MRTPSKLEPGGAIRAWCSPPGAWSTVQAVGAETVTVWDCWARRGKCFARTIPRSGIRATMTAAQVQQARASGRLTPTGAHAFTLTDERRRNDGKPPEPRPNSG